MAVSDAIVLIDNFTPHDPAYIIQQCNESLQNVMTISLCIGFVIGATCVLIGVWYRGRIQGN